MAGTTKRSGAEEASGMQRVEEAVHLLRSAPVAAWVVYLAGAGAWVLGFLLFWAYTTWFAPRDAELVVLSLLLVALFAWLKAAQADFCQRLLAHRVGAAAPAWSAARLARVGVEQLRVQAAGLVVVPVAMVLTVPAAWVIAFYQSCSVLREEGGVPLRTQAWREAGRWPRQNHLGLICLSVLALAVWVNVAAALYLVPYLANRFLGLDNLFGISGWFLINPTFLAFVTALSWLCVDPLLKAFYVLRVFYGRAQETGEDLMVELRPHLRSRAAAVLLLFAFLTAGGGHDARAGTPDVSVERAPSARAGTMDPAALNRSIDRALEGRDFQWRLRPRDRGDLGEEAETGPVRAFVRSSIELVREVFTAVANLVERITSWVRDLFSSSERPTRAAGPGGVTAIRALVYVLLAGVVLLLAWMLWGFYRQRGPRVTPVQAQPVAAVADLNDETLHAGTLPADDWLRLAEEQITRGEWRLALRALYLASLARLAAGGRVSLAKAKTNLDYEWELRRRSPGEETLHASFRVRRRAFERVWYGRTDPEPQRVRAWFDDLQGGAAL